MATLLQNIIFVKIQVKGGGERGRENKEELFYLHKFKKNLDTCGGTEKISLCRKKYFVIPQVSCRLISTISTCFILKKYIKERTYALPI